MPAVRAEGEQTRRGHEVAIRLGTIRKCGWECWRNRRFGHGWPATFSARSASFEVALLGHGSHGVHGQWPVCRRSGEASDMDRAMSDVSRFRRQTPHSPCHPRLPCPNSATSKCVSEGSTGKCRFRTHSLTRRVAKVSAIGLTPAALWVARHATGIFSAIARAAISRPTASNPRSARSSGRSPCSMNRSGGAQALDLAGVEACGVGGF